MATTGSNPFTAYPSDSKQQPMMNTAYSYPFAMPLISADPMMYSQPVFQFGLPPAPFASPLQTSTDAQARMERSDPQMTEDDEDDLKEIQQPQHVTRSPVRQQPQQSKMFIRTLEEERTRARKLQADVYAWFGRDRLGREERSKQKGSLFEWLHAVDPDFVLRWYFLPIIFCDDYRSILIHACCRCWHARRNGLLSWRESTTFHSTRVRMWWWWSSLCRCKQHQYQQHKTNACTTTTTIPSFFQSIIAFRTHDPYDITVIETKVHGASSALVFIESDH